MLPFLIAMIPVLLGIILWIISAWQNLKMLDENVSMAMNQIGVQLSNRFDALTVLLDITKGYAGQEIDALIQIIQARGSEMVSLSTPDEIMRQEGIISDALDRIALVAAKHHELKKNQTYLKVINEVQAFGNMVRISRLIYNDSVSRLNREIRCFPVSIIAGVLGFRQREYIVDQAGDKMPWVRRRGCTHG